MKGYKVFNPDWKCNGFQYKVGETFRHDGEIEVCEAGFHFCENVADCFSYYAFDSKNKVAEIEAVGNVKTYGDKSVTDEIKIVREISWHEMLTLANEGKNCTGLYNTGNCNSGNCNSGNRNSGNCNSGYSNSGDGNSGDRNSGDGNSGNCNSGNRNSGNYNSGYSNSGDRNSGNCNSGDCNSGDRNSGDCNSGDRNSGDYNSGNYNSGDWNSCNFSTGFFNSVSPPVYAFNKPLNISRDKFCKCDGLLILGKYYQNNIWVCSSDMTDEEKENHPEYECMGGYLKTLDFRTAFRTMWGNLSDGEKQKVYEIPNFDPVVFREITGIDVTDGASENV